MKVVAAYLLAMLAGNGAPSPDDVKGILASVGADVEEDRLDLFYKLVEGKDVNELLQLGSQKFASGGGGGGGAVMAASGGGGGAAATGGAAPAAEEEKKEEKEEKEESDDDMGFSLFD
ncbi:60S acidic ribosomal protein P2-1-like [Selaginella moellendorffii]|uniref:60S acidic ribosomal protein P2-1-like n=1 Tax=Selaginella moellendorffii TaxID=88036 RepID=UPI000D1C634C|nr:60S acidic ribosomal protein P2-1-like [Selaginella moellendorffii]|eukprot:XP_024526064.1 60S acidic ribosomal protein P2-1-like [Selaginella moellendorffii]